MALALSNLTAGTDSGLSGTSDSAVTASVTIPADGVAYISVAVAHNYVSSFPVVSSVTGASLTWTALATGQDYGSRRSIRVFRAINTGSETSGALTISFTGVNLQEAEWIVDLATGADTSDPDDTPTSSYEDGSLYTYLNLPDVGTPGTGDAVFCAFGFEGATDGFALGSAFTQLGSQTGGTNVRSLKTGYDITATLDETPDAGWDTLGNTCGGVAFIINVGSSGSTGTLAASESGSDTAAFAGDVLIDGSLAATESGGDTAALAGDVLIAGTFAATESGADVAAIQGTAQQVSTGSLAATESGADTASIAGTVLVEGALAATESGSDTAAIAGDVPVSGTLAATESGTDTAALAGDVYISGALAATESGSDTAALAGEALVSGALAASESGSDVAAFAGDVFVAGALAANESGADTAALSGAVPVSGTFAATETGSDTALFSGAGVVIASGSLAANESGADTADFAGLVLISGSLDATESGADTASFSGPIATGGVTPAGRSRGKRRRVVIRERVYEVNERDIPALIEAELLDRAPPATAEHVAGPKPPRKRRKSAPQPVKTVEQVREVVQQIKARIEPDNAWLVQALEAVAFRVLERLQDEEDSLMLLLAA